MIDINNVNEKLFNSWMRFRTLRGQISSEAFIVADTLYEYIISFTSKNTDLKDEDYYSFSYHKSLIADDLNVSPQKLGTQRKKQKKKTPYVELEEIGFIFFNAEGKGDSTLIKIPLNFEKFDKTTNSNYYNNTYGKDGVYQKIERIDNEIKGEKINLYNTDYKEINYLFFKNIDTFKLTKIEIKKSSKQYKLNKLIKMFSYLLATYKLPIDNNYSNLINMIEHANNDYELVNDAIYQISKIEGLELNKDDLNGMIRQYIKNTLKQRVEQEIELLNAKSLDDKGYMQKVVKEIENKENVVEYLENEINQFKSSIYQDETLERLILLYNREKGKVKRKEIKREGNTFTEIKEEGKLIESKDNKDLIGF